MFKTRLQRMREKRERDGGRIAVAVYLQKCLIHHVAPSGQIKCVPWCAEIHLHSAGEAAVDEAVLSRGQGPLVGQAHGARSDRGHA